MRKEKNKLTALLICLALCSGLLCGCGSEGKAYSEAADLFASGAYDAAYEAFIDLGDYRDSAEMAAKCADTRFEAEYRSAVDLMDNGDIAEAIAAFEALAGYSDSAEKAEKCREALRASDYADALALMDAERFGEAASIFLSLGDYSDSADKKRRPPLSKEAAF